MYYITNLKDEMASLKKNMTSRSAKSEDAILPFYQMDFPFQLEFYTLHPNDTVHYYTMTSLSPDRMIYCCASMEEMYKYLSSPLLHHHNYFELLIVLEGTLYQTIENQRHLYTAGSCCLLNKNVQHREEYSTDYRVAFLDISEKLMTEIMNDFTLGYFEVEIQKKNGEIETFLWENLNQTSDASKKYIDFIPKQDLSWGIANVHHLFDQITRELVNPRIGSSFVIKGLILKLLSLLNDPQNYHTTPVQIGTDTENLLFGEMSRIMAETYGRTSRKELQAALNYSGDYLNKIMHKYTGLSIFEYGMTLCMKEAAYRLSHTDENISDIAASLGFTNRSHFYKLFEKAYHMPPAAYRQKAAAT